MATPKSSKYGFFTEEDITSDVEQKAQVELGESAQIREQSLNKLKQLISKKKNLDCLMDESFLLSFLRYAKFDVDKAFATLCHHYKFKVSHPEYFKYSFDHLKEMLEKTNSLHILPYKTEAGEIIGLWLLGNIDLDKTTMEEAIAAGMSGLDLIFNVEVIQICGVIIIYDFKGQTLRHLWSTLPHLYSIAHGMQKCLPLRLKAIHFVNVPVHYQVLINLARQLANIKVKQRIFNHGSEIKSLHNHIPREILPLEFEGDLGPSDNREMLKYIETKRKLFMKLRAHGYKKLK